MELGHKVDARSQALDTYEQFDTGMEAAVMHRTRCMSWSHLSTLWAFKKFKLLVLSVED